MLPPRSGNEKLGYPHGFLFTHESPILTLLAHRLLGGPRKQENPFANGVWSRTYPSSSLEADVFRAQGHTAPKGDGAVTVVLECVRNVRHLLLLLHRMVEIVPAEVAWE